MTLSFKSLCVECLCACVCFCLEHNTCIGTSQPSGRFIGAICTNTQAQTRPRFARVSVLLCIRQSARNTLREAFSLQIHICVIIYWHCFSRVSRAHSAASVNRHLPLINLLTHSVSGQYTNSLCFSVCVDWNKKTVFPLWVLCSPMYIYVAAPFCIWNNFLYFVWSLLLLQFSKTTISKYSLLSN